MATTRLMAESAAAGQRGGGVAKALFTPNPSIPAWQGIVEICLRVAVLVSYLLFFFFFFFFFSR